MKFKDFLTKNKPIIFSIAGIATIVTSGVFAVKKSKNMYDELDKLNKQKKDPTMVDKIKTLAPIYWPNVTATLIGTMLILESNSIFIKRNAAITAAYKLGERAYINYKDAVKENVEDKVFDAIEDSVSKKSLESDDKIKGYFEALPEGYDLNKDDLIYDKLSGRYFRSDVETVKANLNILNARLVDDRIVTLNDWFDILGLDPTDSGELLGWNIENGLIDIGFSSQLYQGKYPCVVLSYRSAPSNQFNDY